MVGCLNKKQLNISGQDVKVGNVSNLVWVLPRPRADHYPGGFPLYFESKLLRLLQLQPGSRVLHPFAGMAEYGVRVDLDPSVKPDCVANAESLPFRDNTFDLVICDPPYTDGLAKTLYDAPGPRLSRYGKEAVRVCREFGFVCLYHWYMMPRLAGTALRTRVIILQRTWGRPRVATICQKNTAYHAQVFWVWPATLVLVPPKRPGKPEHSVLASSWKGHDSQNKKMRMHSHLTLERAAELQGYPELIESLRPLGNKYAVMLLGNGVPKAMGEYIAKAVKNSFTNGNEKTGQNQA